VKFRSCFVRCLRVRRLVVVLALLTNGACETAPTAAPRAALDTSALPVPLPARGIAVQTFGIGGVYDLAIVDSDARTLRVILHGPHAADTTTPLDAARMQRLDELAGKARAEVASGPMPEAHDVMQDLFIVDRDAGFRLRGYPIYEPGATTGRPFAAALVGEINNLAAPAIERAVAPPAPPPPPKHRHANAVPRTALATPDTDPKVLPLHGVVVHRWGLLGELLIVVDRDAGTIRVVEKYVGDKPGDRKRPLATAALDGIITAAFDAWHETATGPTPVATDVREDLIVLDGDEAFYLSGHPISTYVADEQTGRPAAARAMAAVYRARKR